VAQALALLSDGAFKLHMHLCLQADRHTGQVAWLYFASLIEEVSQPQIPVSYWDHVRHRMEEMEKRWLQMANSVTTTHADPADASLPEML